MHSFALIGAAGYIAPRHMSAIKETGNELVAALDPNDSVGVIDSHFPDAHFFTEFERFDRHIDKCRRKGQPIDYISICSPNYLHDSHIRFALRSGADAICEKPLVLNPWNIDAIKDMENETGKKVHSILQLRLHDSVNELKRQVENTSSREIFDVEVTYVTSRGNWYGVSWKGDEKKAGGVPTNIGVHFYDMLYYIFGDLKANVLHYQDQKTAAGYLEYERARVRWLLSVDKTKLPEHIQKAGQRTYRSITVEGKEFEFSGGFSDLHTKSYEAVIQGKGFGLDENYTAIETVSAIRNMEPDPSIGLVHPLLPAILEEAKSS